MKLTLNQKIRSVLYGTNAGYTDEQLAQMFGTSASSIRGAVMQLRGNGFNVVKRLTRENGVVGKAKYYMPKGVAEAVMTYRGRPAHAFLK